jgi:hypothetical protein
LDLELSKTTERAPRLLGLGTHSTPR